MIIPYIVLFLIYPLILFPVSVRNRYASLYFAPAKETQYDLYLLGKEWLLFILGALILIIILFRFRNRIKLKELMPLSVFVGLLTLSALFSVSRDLSFNGANELFEPFSVLLCYIIVFCGAGFLLLLPDREKKLRILLLAAAAGAALISLIGLYQAVKGKPVSSTLYNPDYVGSYAAIVIPGFLLFLILRAGKRDRLWYGVLAAALLSILLLIFSGSAAGIGGTALGTAVGAAPYFLKRRGKGVMILPAALLLTGVVSIAFLWNASYSEYAYPDFSLKTGGKYAEFSNGDEKLLIRCEFDSEDGDEFSLLDGKGNAIPFEGDPEKRSIVAKLPPESSFYGFHFNPFSLNNGQRGFMVFCLDRQWYFGEDSNGNCHTLNAYGKMTDLITAESFGFFRNREAFIHGRGYIWDRTFPLMEKYWLFGCGPDAFPLVFPQNDIDKIMKSDMPYENLVLKPHSFYLQTGVQLGLPFLIIMLAFLGMTIIRLYKIGIREDLRGMDRVLPLICLSSLTGFFTASLINDSSLCVTPLAIALWGLGWTSCRQNCG